MDTSLARLGKAFTREMLLAICLTGCMLAAGLAGCQQGIAGSGSNASNSGTSTAGSPQSATADASAEGPSSGQSKAANSTASSPSKITAKDAVAQGQSSADASAGADAGQSGQSQQPGLQQWSADMQPQDYFANNIVPADSMMSSSYISFADDGKPIRYFSTKRQALLDAQAIPAMPGYDFLAQAKYNDDGSLYYVIFNWHRDTTSQSEATADTPQYGDLSVIIAPQAIDWQADHTEALVDASGRETPIPSTQTVRDDVVITAEGYDRGAKTLSYVSEAGWYRIEASHANTYDDAVSLLDWFWGYPLDFSLFAAELGMDNSDEEAPALSQEYM